MKFDQEIDHARYIRLLDGKAIERRILTPFIITYLINVELFFIAPYLINLEVPRFVLPILSAAVLATADLVRLGVEVPEVLVPEHPAVVDRVAVGAVVVAVGRVATLPVAVAIVCLYRKRADSEQES